MLKKISFYLCITFIVVLCVYSIYLMYRNDANYEVVLDENEIIADDNADETYIVGYDNVIESISLTGSAQPVYEDERVEIYIEGKAEDIYKYVKAGDVIEKNAIYASYKGKEYKANSKMQCIDIQEDDGGVIFQFVDYSKLYIEIGIPEKYADSSLRDKEVEVVYNDTSFTGNITYIDGYCNENVVSSKITYANEDILLRPGTKCQVNIIIQNKENVVAVPLEFVIYSEYEDEYRIMLVEGDKTITQTIKIGVIGDSMVEVISGLNADACIMMPRDEMSLKYYLNNSEEVAE